jgi:hypothetical protein
MYARMQQAVQQALDAAIAVAAVVAHSTGDDQFDAALQRDKEVQYLLKMATLATLIVEANAESDLYEVRLYVAI